MNLSSVGRDRWARRRKNGRPSGPALPGSWPLSRSGRNNGLPMNWGADFSPQEPWTGQRACGLKSALRGRFLIPTRVPGWKSKLPRNLVLFRCRIIPQRLNPDWMAQPGFRCCPSVS